MSRFGMVIDTRKCVGCMDCVVACETENNVPVGFSSATNLVEAGYKGDSVESIVRALVDQHAHLVVDGQPERAQHPRQPQRGHLGGQHALRGRPVERPVRLQGFLARIAGDSGGGEQG